MSEVADAVRQIVAEHLSVDASRVTPDATFIDDLGADSLDAIELLMTFEEGALGVPARRGLDRSRNRISR
jgi:acyl carrier protein